MNHKVQDIEKLHRDACSMYTNVVLSNADSILSDLAAGIENLKNNWKGKDAGIQIQNVIEVYNFMVVVRNSLAEFAVDSTKVASNYREIQNTNGVRGESLSVLSYEPKSKLSDYSDTADTVDINPSAETGRTKISNANEAISTFQANAESQYNEIIYNWTAGTGLDKAQEAFASFKTNVTNYQTILAQVTSNITQALSNYQF